MEHSGSDWTPARSRAPLRPGRLGSRVWVSTVSDSTCGSVQLERQTASIDLRRVFESWPSPAEFDPAEAPLSVLASKTFFLLIRRKPEDVWLDSARESSI